MLSVINADICSISKVYESQVWKEIEFVISAKIQRTDLAILFCEGTKWIFQSSVVEKNNDVMRLRMNKHN